MRRHPPSPSEDPFDDPLWYVRYRTDPQFRRPEPAAASYRGTEDVGLMVGGLVVGLFLPATVAYLSGIAFLWFPIAVLLVFAGQASGNRGLMWGALAGIVVNVVLAALVLIVMSAAA